jgi:hypothetical protein
MDTRHPLFDLLLALERAHISFVLQRNRPNTVLVTITLVGERLEVDVFDDGHMEVSRFKGDETIVGDCELVYSLIRQET